MRCRILIIGRAAKGLENLINFMDHVGDSAAGGGSRDHLSVILPHCSLFPMTAEVEAEKGGSFLVIGVEMEALVLWEYRQGAKSTHLRLKSFP